VDIRHIPSGVEPDGGRGTCTHQKESYALLEPADSTEFGWVLLRVVWFRKLGSNKVAANDGGDAMAPALHPRVIAPEDRRDAFLSEEILEGGWSIRFGAEAVYADVMRVEAIEYLGAEGTANITGLRKEGISGNGFMESTSV
jgi:hypothetical protein